jgi:DNA-binding winged helix-turn-helix (wHTH) protein
VVKPSIDDLDEPTILRFGVFELDYGANRLAKNGRTVKLQPQPFKLLCLLARRAGQVVTRDDIRAALWSEDTYVDFDQGVNFTIKQVREALDDHAEHSLYIQTVPKRGYRFLAPVDFVSPPQGPAFWPGTDPSLHKALWANIAELRVAEGRRNERDKKLKIALAVVAAGAMLAVAVVLFLIFRG